MVEEHDGLQFTVQKEINENYGPFTLSSVKQGSQVYLQIVAAKQAGQGGGCDSCSSCS